MLLQSSAYNLRKKIQMCQYLLYDYHLVYILATIWDTWILNSAVFLHTVPNPLATQSRLLFQSNYLKSITEGLSFQIHLCQTQV